MLCLLQDLRYLSTITVMDGKVYAMFVKCPTSVSAAPALTPSHPALLAPLGLRSFHALATSPWPTHSLCSWGKRVCVCCIQRPSIAWSHVHACTEFPRMQPVPCRPPAFHARAHTLSSVLRVLQLYATQSEAMKHIAATFRTQ